MRHDFGLLHRMQLGRFLNKVNTLNSMLLTTIMSLKYLIVKFTNNI